MKILLTVILLGTFTTTTSNDEYPNTSISNGLLNAKIYLPDANSGYYQGTRFDWAGVIPELTYEGHSFFGFWNPHPSYALHDAIAGPVEEFGAIGYEQAKVGETFLKIGVGTLVKDDEQPYKFSKTFEIADYGEWKVKRYKSKVVFAQILKTKEGYAYEYIKTLSMTKSKPELIIGHILKNTGTKQIATSQYNHNFLIIDNELTNSNIKTTFNYDLKAEGRNFGEIAEIKEKSISYKREIGAKENVYSENIGGFGKTSEDYDILIQNLKTKAQVQIKGDQALEKMVFWACRTTSCPEPYVRISVQPGETQEWKISYTFKIDQ